MKQALTNYWLSLSADRRDSIKAASVICSIVGVIMLAGYLFLCHAQAGAKERARQLVGEHEIAGAKWFMFQGRVEYYTAAGETISVPVQNEFTNETVRAFLGFGKGIPKRVRAEYCDAPAQQHKESYAKLYDEGTYLRFTLLNKN